MPTPSTKKKVKKIAAEDPLSSSGVSSLSGISSYNIRKITIYKNGDRFHRAVKFVINPRVIKDMEPLLNQINDRIELSHGAKKLYTADGKVVGSIKELEDGKIYVAASAQFIPMRYGEFAEKVWKPPSRKHSPIMSSDRIKTARTRSQDPGRRRQPQNSGVSNASQATGSGVQRSRSVKTLAEDRKSRRDNSNVARNGTVAQPPKKFDQPRPKAPVPKQSIPKPRRTLPAPTTTNKKPPTPKRKISKKVIGAAVGVGVTVVGAAALGAVAAASKKGKPATPKPKPIPTAASDISTSSVIPSPNVETSGAAEILEFPEEEKKIDVAMIHRTPTPPHIPSRSASAKSLKKAPGTPAADRQPTPEESSEDEGHEDDDEDEDVEDDEEEAGSEEVEEPSEEEEEGSEEEDEEDEEEEEEESRAGTPASRKSSSAVSSAGSHDEKAKKEEEPKK